MGGGAAAGWVYLSKVFLIVPTAKGRGSMISAAPYFLAATMPAPYFMPPWVRVGPSSMTRTRLPVIRPPSLTIVGELARMIVALGLILLALARTRAIPSCLAVSILLMTMTWARRKFVSPGWERSAWPARGGAATTLSGAGVSDE